MDEHQESSDEQIVSSSKKGSKRPKAVKPKTSPKKQASPKNTKQTKRDEKYLDKLRSSKKKEVMAEALIPEEFKVAILDLGDSKSSSEHNERALICDESLDGDKN